MNSPSLCVKDVRNIIHELKKFQEYYTERFRTKTKNLKDQALQFLKCKFLERGHGNMTSYAKVVPETNNQKLQHFISEPNWAWKCY